MLNPSFTISSIRSLYNLVIQFGGLKCFHNFLSNFYVAGQPMKDMNWDQQIMTMGDHTTDITVGTHVMDTGTKIVCRHHRPTVRVGRAKGRLTIAITTHNIPVEIVVTRHTPRTNRRHISRKISQVRGATATASRTPARASRAPKRTRGRAPARRTIATRRGLCGRGVSVDRAAARARGAGARTRGVVCRGATIGRGDPSVVRTQRVIGKVATRRTLKAQVAHSSTQDYVSETYHQGQAVCIFHKNSQTNNYMYR